jgi:hypothetical protein
VVTVFLAPPALRIIALLTPGQIDNLGIEFSSDLLELCAAHPRLEDPEIRSLDGDNGKPGSTRTLSYVATLAYKDLGHRTLLSG